MVFSGDYGTYFHNGRSPSFHPDGILGAIAAYAVCDFPRAFAPFEGNGASAAPHLSARAENDRLSRHVRAGLLLLVGSCAWIVGGEKGAKQAIARATPNQDRNPADQNQRHQQVSVRTLSSADAPELFAEIDRICWRAKLQRRPLICVLVGHRMMNAYAFGGPDDAVITFTEGLLRGMTTKEVGAIFAHEIAHICNGDSSTMAWAAHLQRAINDVSAAALTRHHAPHLAFGCAKPQSSPHWLLERAPAIAELLMLALSRFREIEADAFAVELTGDAKTLETALAKLEQHHRALSGIPEAFVEDRLDSYLRSHPMTSERIGHLRASPLYGVASYGAA